MVIQGKIANKAPGPKGGGKKGKKGEEEEEKFGVGLAGLWAPTVSSVQKFSLV